MFIFIQLQNCNVFYSLFCNFFFFHVFKKQGKSVKL